MQCDILMETLIKSPYNLRNDDYIVAHGRSRNQWGPGKYSETSARTTQMHDIPTRSPKNLSQTTQGVGTLKITWDRLPNVHADGQEHGEQYELWWDKGSRAPWEKLAETKLTTSHILYNYSS